MNWEINPGAANDGRPDIRHLRSEFNFDIDGRPHTLIVDMEQRPFNAKIIRDFDKKILYDGAPPGGPFGIEAAMFVAEKLNIGLT